MPDLGLQGSKPFRLAVGPVVGISDAIGLAAADLKRGAAMVECYAPFPEINEDLLARAGFNRSCAAKPLTGTVTVTSGSATLAGLGTQFVTQLSPGDLVTLAGGAQNVVQSIANATTATMTQTWGVNLSGVTASENDAGIDGGFLHVNQFSWTDGTEHTVVIGYATSTVYAGGGTGLYRFVDGTNGHRLKLAVWNPTTGKFVDQTTTSMDSVALSSTDRLYSTVFANYLILKDQTNRPYKINTSWVLATLTDCNIVTYGPPWIYYGLLWFITLSDRATLIWSQPNDPDHGYGVTALDNSAWTLLQTGVDPMVCGIGTNDAVYIFRTNSITAITGQANSDFQSSGTIAAVSNTTGTRSPDSVCKVEGAVWFVDTYGRPYCITSGNPVPLFARCYQTIKSTAMNQANLAFIWGRYSPELQVVVFAFRKGASSTGNEQALVFSSRTQECLGTWTPSGVTDMAYGAIIKDLNMRPALGVLQGGTADISLYNQLQETDPNINLDVTAAGNVPVMAALTTGQLVGSPDTVKTVGRIVVESEYTTAGQPGLTLAFKTTTQSSFTNLTDATLVTVGTNQPSRAVWDADVRDVRYLQLKISKNAGDTNRFAIGRVIVMGDETNADYAYA